jgi:hypothetical protein
MTYVVRWVPIKGSGKIKIRKKRFEDFVQALVFFIGKDSDPYNERSELVSDPTYDPMAKVAFETTERLVKRYNEAMEADPEEDEEDGFRIDELFEELK